jgi:hypothetical protein
MQVEDDVVTPSMKLKRPQLQKKYQKEIDALCVFKWHVCMCPVSSDDGVL